MPDFGFALPTMVGLGLAVAVGLTARAVGVDRERGFYPLVLIVIASYYLLFAVMAGGAGVSSELVVFALFTAAALIGFRSSLWIVVIGLATHGLFDLSRGVLLLGDGVPTWWPSFCSAYDLTAALGLGTLLTVRERRTKILSEFSGTL